MNFYPCILLKLEPGDAGYDRGARVMVCDVDEEQYAFPTSRAAQCFMGIHGLQQIDETEMQALRTAIAERRVRA